MKEVKTENRLNLYFCGLRDSACFWESRKQANLISEPLSCIKKPVIKSLSVQ